MIRKVSLFVSLLLVNLSLSMVPVWAEDVSRGVSSVTVTVINEQKVPPTSSKPQTSETKAPKPLHKKKKDLPQTNEVTHLSGRLWEV